MKKLSILLGVLLIFGCSNADNDDNLPIDNPDATVLEDTYTGPNSDAVEDQDTVPDNNDTSPGDVDDPSNDTNDPSIDANADGECGEICQGPRVCHQGECICSKTAVLCDGECIDPKTNNLHCGAKGSCVAMSGDNFKGVSCGDKASCQEGECIPFDCAEGESLCHNAAGQLECIDLTSHPEHCGQCGWNCEDKLYGSLKFDGTCSKGECSYACAPEDNCEALGCSTNICIEDVAHYPGFQCSADVYFTAAQCGGCKATGKREMLACSGELSVCSVNVSNEMICTKGWCEGNVCTNSKTGECENSVDSCGRTCMNCMVQPYVVAAECSEEGLCKITECELTFHVSEDQSHCVPNNPKACATVTVTSDNAADCTAIENAAYVECKANGTCLVNSCKPGFHIADTRDSCVANSPEACGLATAFGEHVIDCTKRHTEGKVVCNALGICEAL